MMDKIERLKKLDNEKLIDVVRNYRQYGYDETFRAAAISILDERGIKQEELKLFGNFENHTYDFANDLYTSFGRNSKIAFALYLVLLISTILTPILIRSSETLSIIILIVTISAYISYFVFLIRSFINQNQFYKIIGEDYGTEGAILYFLAGMPLYIFMYFYFSGQMKEKMQGIQ